MSKFKGRSIKKHQVISLNNCQSAVDLFFRWLLYFISSHVEIIYSYYYLGTFWTEFVMETISDVDHCKYLPSLPSKLVVEFVRCLPWINCFVVGLCVTL